jgi:hypothetical protein
MATHRRIEVTDSRRPVQAIDLWLLDLALTATSFFLAYGLRTRLEVSGRTFMPFEVYAPTLVLIVAVWAVILPAFRVYSPHAAGGFGQLRRLLGALLTGWIFALIAETVLVRSALVANWGSSKALLLLTLLINVFLLISYRLLLFRRV